MKEAIVFEGMIYLHTNGLLEFTDCGLAKRLFDSPALRKELERQGYIVTVKRAQVPNS